MSIHEGAKRLAWTATKGIEELAVSISVYVDANPMFSSTVGRVCVGYYNRWSFLYTCWKSIARKHPHKLSTAPSR